MLAVIPISTSVDRLGARVRLVSTRAGKSRIKRAHVDHRHVACAAESRQRLCFVAVFIHGLHTRCGTRTRACADVVHAHPCTYRASCRACRPRPVGHGPRGALTPLRCALIGAATSCARALAEPGHVTHRLVALPLCEARRLPVKREFAAPLIP